MKLLSAWGVKWVEGRVVKQRQNIGASGERVMDGHLCSDSAQSLQEGNEYGMIC